MKKLTPEQKNNLEAHFKVLSGETTPEEDLIICDSGFFLDLDEFILEGLAVSDFRLIAFLRHLNDQTLDSIISILKAHKILFKSTNGQQSLSIHDQLNQFLTYFEFL